MNCGEMRKFVGVNTQKKLKGMYCKNCGKKISDDSKFCMYCGVRQDVMEVGAFENSEESSKQKNEEHEWVDLGLPSGTLWATCNVGAEKPEDYGDYFAWGETKPKDVYNMKTYKYWKGSQNTLTKYNTDTYYGETLNNKTELDIEDDAAYVNWGEDWRMPSDEQFYELLDDKYTTQEWTSREGQYGTLIISNSNGNSVFLPAEGYRKDSSLNGAGSFGNYWSRTLNEDYPIYAMSFGFLSSGICEHNYYSYYGRSVRPVRR